jgi:hypothetical protein
VICRRGAEIRHEQRSEMLGISPARYVRERFLRHGGAKGALDEREGGDVAVVHDGVDAECEGVVVGGCYCCGGRGSDVCEEYGGGGVSAETAKVGVVERRLDGFVEGGV